MRWSNRPGSPPRNERVEFYVASPRPLTTRWLVRFGYDGTGVSGWARQPGRATVEGTLRAGLKGRGIASSPSAARVEVASRTDRGVSARANVVALTSDLSGAALLDRLNSISPALWFTAATPATPGLRVRAALRRVYRYFDPDPVRRPEVLARACALFRGRIDTRSFGRGLPPGTPAWRSVDSVTFETLGTGTQFDVVAPSFVWGMVRKIVGSLREVDAGRLSLADLEEATRGRRRLTLPMAEPEGLVLWSVELPSVTWSVEWTGANRYQRRFWQTEQASVWRRDAVIRALTDEAAREGARLGASVQPTRSQRSSF